MCPNAGSFGAPPEPVRAVENRLRDSWYEYPDLWYFGGELHRQNEYARECVGKTLRVPSSEIAVLSNATDATLAVAQRWSNLLAKAPNSQEDVVMMLDLGYASNKLILDRTCARRGGARVEMAHVPFPIKDEAEVLDSFETALRKHRPRFVLLEHVLSQPAMLLPVNEMVAMCRSVGVEEVAVDAAHSFMLSDIDIHGMDCDWWWSNMHKWGFGSCTATPIWGRAELMETTEHPIISWHVGEGLPSESAFTGTRDYHGVLSTPAALSYRDQWRDEKGRNHADHCKEGLAEGCELLRSAWQTEPASPAHMMASMGMVQLPPALVINDVPGVPGKGVRHALRERFKIEAAVANFGAKGNFVRVSHALYTTMNDYQRLVDAVDTLISEQ